ncbi:hypothetical protein [Helicobacter sp. 23-1046]
MSIKKDLEQIKDSFDRDGQILESAFRFEVLFKRYKKILFAFGVIVIVGIIAWLANTAITQSKHDKAAKAYYDLLNANENEDSENLLRIIKENNPVLHDLYVLSHNPSEEQFLALTDSQNAFIAKIATYQNAQNAVAKILQELESNQEQSFNPKLDEALKSLDSIDDKHLKAFALLQESVLLLREGRTQEAKHKAQLIDENSPFAKFGELIKHYK